jgi:hypothetical protein
LTPSKVLLEATTTLSSAAIVARFPLPEVNVDANIGQFLHCVPGGEIAGFFILNGRTGRCTVH